MSQSPVPTVKPGKIAVYNGKGAKLALETLESLRAEVDEDVNPVIPVDAADIRRGTILKETALFIGPGGDDRFFCEELDGAGTDNLSDFAMRMALLLFCGSSYFASPLIEYHKGLHDEVIATRRMGLYPGKAVSVDTDFNAPYDGKIQSVYTPIIEMANGKKFSCFAHGGCKFVLDPGYEFGGGAHKLIAIGRYDELPDKPVAIARINHSQGGISILSGVHFELPGPWVAGHLNFVPSGGDYTHIGSSLQASEPERRMLLRSSLRQCCVRLSDQPKVQHLANPLKSFLPRRVFDDVMVAPA